VKLSQEKKEKNLVNMVNNSKKYLQLLQLLYQSKVHLGHNISICSPKMGSYILAPYKGTHIIDLEKTIPLLKRALSLISLLYNKGTGVNVLIVGNNRVNKPYITELIKNKNVYGVWDKWVGGSLTNWNPKHFKYSSTNSGIPGLVIFLNTAENGMAIKEAVRKSIPIISILDTDSNPDGIQYPIPGNDDSPQAQYLYYKLISEALKK
jgi:small subunit ribosomal protein S2